MINSNNRETQKGENNWEKRNDEIRELNNVPDATQAEEEDDAQGR